MTSPVPELFWARLTARGVGGLAVFRLQGAATEALLARMFEPRGQAPVGPGQLRAGAVIDGGAVLDDGVLRVSEGPRGWEAELSVHGSLYVTDRIEALLGAAGGKPLPPALAWGGASGPADRIVVEAREELLRAFSDLQTAFFLHALDGGLGCEVRSLEAALGGAAGRGAHAALVERLEVLVRRAPYGLAMTTPPAVVLTGPPNAGKSTLFNALLGESRAIVSAEPGTTRDVISEPVAIGGFPFRLADSAGIRDASEPVESEGVARARAAATAADIVVVLIDPEADVEDQARSLQGTGRSRVAVLAKSDLPAAARARRDTRPGPPLLPVSGLTRAGVAELRERIVAASAFGGPADVRQPVPFLPRHVADLGRARDALQGGGAAAAARAIAALRDLHALP